MDNFEQYLPELLTIFTASFIAFTSPGPNFMAITSQSVVNRINGLACATGISLGTALWAFLAATGLSTLLSAVPILAMLIGILGSGYLIWLGVKSFKAGVSWQKFSASGPSNQKVDSPFQAFISGILIQLTNPKTALFWLALTAIVITPETPWIVIVALVIGCFMLALLWHFFLAIAFSSGPIRNIYIRYKPIFSIIFGIIFIFFGMRFLYTILFVGLVQ